MHVKVVQFVYEDKINVYGDYLMKNLYKWLTFSVK